MSNIFLLLRYGKVVKGSAFESMAPTSEKERGKGRGEGRSGVMGDFTMGRKKGDEKRGRGADRAEPSSFFPPLSLFPPFALA